jgi:hypothetical protein
MSRFNQEITRRRTMVSPDVRNNIIDRIDSGELESETFTGTKAKWWKNKHHPNKQIPKRIYLLGSGSPKELYTIYINNPDYEYIERREFYNYTRELIKQNIMV